ncbi:MULTISPECIES: DUF5064 family protein [unclassified Pseudomonas]|uniref:DUF5064 family protein n=1 Tax=unclassified Pseudomonas TaxID=196821 RepID=UPI002B2339C4|nr:MULTISPECIES: DUF5064 family protein [unclassified Pseudomonas]MEA9977705.1 DUF5064 family protein [Pseudomonas sp. RTS4]MEB0199136.1 DUF5064 family protein [Pseudomonas sp. 5S4]MEB0246568.1 DUF5064 family protein [Pseudomonas sp. 10S5]
MYEPGHLYITRAALQPDDFGYDIHIHYEVHQDPKDGAYMHFSMVGDVNGDAFEDTFDLPRDSAFNFASVANKIAIKHGLPHTATLPLAMHKQYDEMFEDVRAKLAIKSGEPVKPEHLK